MISTHQHQDGLSCQRHHHETSCQSSSSMEHKRKRVTFGDPEEQVENKKHPSSRTATTSPSTPPDEVQETPHDQPKPPLISSQMSLLVEELSRRESIVNRILICCLRFPLQQIRNNESSFAKLFNGIMYQESLTYFDNAVVKCSRRFDEFTLEFMNADMASRALHLNHFPLVEHRGAAPNRIMLYRPKNYSGDGPRTNANPPTWLDYRGENQRLQRAKSCDENRSRTIVVEACGLVEASPHELQTHFGRLLEKRSLSVRHGNPVVYSKKKGGDFYLCFRTLEEATFALNFQTVEFKGVRLRVRNFGGGDRGPSRMSALNVNKENLHNISSDQVKNYPKGTGAVEPLEQDNSEAKKPINTSTAVQVQGLEELLQLTRKELQQSQQSCAKLKVDLDQSNNRLKDTRSQLEVAHQDKAKLKVDLDFSNAKREYTLSQLIAAQKDNAKLQDDIVEANCNLEDTLSQLEGAKQDKKKLQVDLDEANKDMAKIQDDLEEANQEHENAIGQLEASRQDNARLQVVLDHISYNLEESRGQLEEEAKKEEARKKALLLMEKELTTTRAQLEQMKQELAVAQQKLVKQELPSRKKRRVSLDYDVSHHEDSSKSNATPPRVLKVTPNKREAVKDDSEDKIDVQHKTLSLTPVKRRSPMESPKADANVSGHTKCGTSLDYQLEAIRQNHSQNIVPLEEMCILEI